MENRKQHWEQVYETKSFEQVSWFQDVPQTSIDFFKQASLPTDAHIIDVGGGESRFVDFLLQEGYTNITVLDISEKAIERKRTALGEKASAVKWIVSDIVTFLPTERYDFWHDRATFHFLTAGEEIERYVQTIKEAVNPNGYLLIGTFAKDGAAKCSGLTITQYSEEELVGKFVSDFNKITCLPTEHTTPFETIQRFVFCMFQKK
ncbi:MAG: class I SAM-dependent methyltransferase [Bacteroidetes bacterium]|nr:MAG: class I SAM-dependent methyltransferase [Bacteroidota bacterium]